MNDTASVFLTNTGDSAQVGPMTVAQAIAKVIADSATYRATWYAVIFHDCTACGGEGFNDGRRCGDCSDRQDELEACAAA